MLGPDVVVEQAICFFSSELQDPFGLGAERNLDRRRHLLAENRPSFDFLANVFQRKMRARKNAACEALAFPNQPKKQMLGLNGNAAELTGLVTCEE